MRKVAICMVGWLGCLLVASAWASVPNQIRITVPTHAVAGTPNHPETYTVSVHGYARRRASAYLFIDYSGCAKSFSAEYKRTVKAGRVHWAVLGSFHNPSYWGSNGAGPDHACAYLLAKGTRTVLARSSVPFRIYPRH